MTEDKFYDICDNIDKLPKQYTEGYYPTIEELENNDVAHHMDQFMYLLIYFGNDPYKGIVEDDEYKAMVKYVKDLLLKFDFEEEINEPA